jgi:hypothetical protein
MYKALTIFKKVSDHKTPAMPPHKSKVTLHRSLWYLERSKESLSSKTKAHNYSKARLLYQESLLTQQQIDSV